MASSTAIATRRSIVTTVVILTLVALVFAGLAALYFILQRPTNFDTTGNKDRNYLFSIYGFEGDLLRRPTSVGIDSQGNIHVADTAKRRIVMFDGTGKFITTYGDPGKGNLQLWDPIDVAVADDGRSFVVDKTQKKIVTFDATHKAIKSVTFAEEAPLSATIKNGRLYVTTESGIVIGDLNAKFTTGYIRRGKAGGSFDRPGSVAVGSDGTMYVADSLNYRVQAIGSNGKVKWTYGESIPASAPIQFNSTGRKFGLPASITIDDNGFLYVVDGLSSELVVLDTSGALVERIGDVGHADGAFYYPDGIDYANGRLVIADKFNDRVEVFSDPHNRAVADTLAMNWPWGLLLLAVPLVLIPLLRRRSDRFVMTPAFAGALVSRERGEEIAAVLKQVAATDDLSSAHAEDFEKLHWNPHTFDKSVAADLAEKFGLEREEGEALAIAVGMKRAVLLSDSDALTRAASDLDVNSVTYAELRDALNGDKKDDGAVGEAS